VSSAGLLCHDLRTYARGEVLVPTARVRVLPSFAAAAPAGGLDADESEGTGDDGARSVRQRQAQAAGLSSAPRALLVWPQGHLVAAADRAAVHVWDQRYVRAPLVTAAHHAGAAPARLSLATLGPDRIRLCLVCCFSLCASSACVP
jgi:hypothetical protein